MSKKISLRLQNDIYEALYREASQARVSISDVVREKILQSENLNGIQDQSLSLNADFKNQTSEILSLISKQENSQRNNPTLVEILFLLRELLLQRDGAIIKKVDAMLDRRFGKERIKIL